MKKIFIQNQGYALLFAVLVSAVVLGVGVSILNISRKEILLTAGAQKSQYAFYAADAGYECSLYQDLKLNVFSDTANPPASIQCGVTYPSSSPTLYSSPVKLTAQTPIGNTTEYDYAFFVPVSNAGSCAAVTISKFITTVTVGTSTVTTASTTVISDGFNIGWNTTVSPPDCSASNDTKVERALLANY